jgi:hypothetical protein
MIRNLCLGVLALFLLAFVVHYADACGGNGRTIAQTGGCSGGTCGAPSVGGGGGSINPAPVPEFASTWSGSRTMTSPSRYSKPTAQQVAMQLPLASPSKSLTTTTNGSNTQQMLSARKASEVPYIDSTSLTTTTDGANTQQMPSRRQASQVPIEANADKPASVAVRPPDRQVTRLTFSR